MKEQEELGGLAIDKGDLDGIEIGKTLTGLILLPVTRVFMEGQHIAFVPHFELEGAGATGVASKVLAPMLRNLAGDDAAVGHA